MNAYKDHKMPPILAMHIMFQVFQGLEYLQSNSILHRDIKPENIMIDENFNVKISDFGISRTQNICNRPLTPNLQTIYYRAPEILFGDCLYTSAVDMWSAGCLLFEVFEGTPLFCADSELELFLKIVSKKGMPNVETWPGLVSTPKYQSLGFKQMQNIQTKSLKTTLPEFAKSFPEIIPLLEKLLAYNPDERPNAREVLQSRVIPLF